MSIINYQLTRRPILCLLLLLTAFVAKGQSDSYNPMGSPADTNSDQQPKGVIDNPEEPDSILRQRVFFFKHHLGAVKISQIFHPTLSPIGAQFNDRLDALNGNYYLSKGLVGQSHYAIFPTFGEDLDWHYQPNVNIGYFKTPHTVKFYQTQRPFTSLSYQSSLKKEYVIHASHSQNITPRWNLSLDYDLINPESIFSNSSVQNHYLDITTNYYSSDSRYQGYAGVIWQKFYISENGGLSDDHLFTANELSNLSGLPVNRFNDRSVYNTLNLFTHQSYNLVRQVQQVVERSTVSVNSNDSSLLDTLYWNDTITPATPHVFNSGVFGLDLALERSSRKFFDSTTTFHYYGFLFWTNDAYLDSRWKNPFKVTVGIRPQITHINEHDSLYSTFASFSPYAKAVIAIDRSVITATGEYALGNAYYANDRLLKADYSLRLDSLRTAGAYIALSSQSPDYLYLHYHSNGHQWDNENLQKVSTLRIGLQYSHEEAVQCHLTAQHIGHNVWLEGDSNTLHVVQTDGNAWLFQGRLMMQLKLWGWLHYDMQQLLQYSTDQNQIPVPLFASKNSLYANVLVFKKALRLQVGIDIRYHTPFHAEAFDAPTGTFVHQNQIEVGNYFWGDFFVNLQIKRATIYLKAGHVNSLWETHPTYFILPHYPGNKFGLYYGISWKFFD